jgi:hypothetical protein
MVTEWANWIQSTRLSNYFRDVAWIVPTSQSIHIVCVAIVLGSACMISFRLLGLTQPGRSIVRIVDTVVPWMYGCVVVLLLTGVVQTIAEPRRQFLTTVFWAKMLMVMSVVTLTVWFAGTVRRNAPAWDGGAGSAGRRRAARMFALVSLGLWAGIVICGRLIAYAWLFQSQHG